MIRMDDTLEATARLLRKGFGPGSTFSEPTVGGSYMYFVELDLPPGKRHAGSGRSTR
jgi:hypothetical protein